jgi:hypothetical protein
LNDRKGARPPTQNDETLIDAGAIKLALGLKDNAALRRWAATHNITPVRKGAHGAWLYRLDDIAEAR